MSKGPSAYARIAARVLPPKGVENRCELSPTERLVALAIASHFGDQEKCWPGYWLIESVASPSFPGNER